MHTNTTETVTTTEQLDRNLLDLCLGNQLKAKKRFVMGRVGRWDLAWHLVPCDGSEHSIGSADCLLCGVEYGLVPVLSGSRTPREHATYMKALPPEKALRVLRDREVMQKDLRLYTRALALATSHIAAHGIGEESVRAAKEAAKALSSRGVRGGGGRDIARFFLVAHRALVRLAVSAYEVEP